jgi:hypothetical protein
MAQRSLYELMHGSLTVVAKQHLVYHFAGAGQENGKNWYSTGSGTDLWDDEGMQLTPSSGYMANHLNNNLQYAKRASRCIWVTRLEKVTGGSMYNGFISDYNSVSVDESMFFIHGNGAALVTADATTASYCNTSDDGNAQGIYPDKTTTWEIENLASSTNGYINGVLNASSTLRLSSDDFQPMMVVHAGAIGRANYCEAWNT